MPNAPVTWLQEFIVNITTDSSQTEPVVITLTNGNIVVAWTTFSDADPASAAGSDIVGRIFDPLGTPVTGEIRLNQGFFADSEDRPDLTALPGGGFAMVYEDSDGSTNSIRLNTFDANGVVVTTTTVFQDEAGDPTVYNPRIAAASDTSVFITYEQWTGSNMEIRGRVYNPSTNTVGSDIGLLALADGNYSPDVAALSNGNFVIVGRHGGSDSGIYMRIVTGGGGNVLGFTPIAGTNTNTYYDAEPVVTALAGGGYAVAWTGPDANDTDIMVAVYSNTGTLVGTDYVGSSSTDSDNEPAIVGLADGTFVVLYDDDESLTVEIARFSASGLYMGNTRLSDVDPDTLTVSALPDGRIAAVWELTNGELVMELLDVRDAQDGAGTMHTGTAGNDVINYAGPAVFVGGGAGNDTINAGNTAPLRVFDGGDGNDLITVGSNVNGDTYRGGSGSDTIDWSGSPELDGVYFELFAGYANDGLNNESMTGFEHLIATNGNDTVYGTGASNTLTGLGGIDYIDGRAGDDELSGGGGNDTLRGGSGLDKLIGGANDDNLYGDGSADILNGGDGNDYLEGGGGGDTLNGGAGTDLASYFASASGVTVDLLAGTNSGGDAAGDTLISIEYLWGSNHDDRLTGNNFDNRIFGHDGVDRLFGEGGRDYLFGGSGSDIIRGGTGDDELDGGLGGDDLNGGGDFDVVEYWNSNAGVNVNMSTGVNTGGHANGDIFTNIEGIRGSQYNDTFVGDANANYAWGAQGDDVLTGGGGDDTLDGYDGNDTLNGNSGHDTLNGRIGNDAINGGDGDDTITGDEGTDALQGGAGNDGVYGGGGDDAVYGGDGNDYLTGDGGDDLINGGTGNDTLIGGAGKDTFVQGGTSGQDVIVDFTAGAAQNDKIQLDSAMFVNFADILANTINDGLGNCVIAKFGIQITLQGVLKNQLHANDFELIAMAPPLDPPAKPLTSPLIEDDEVVGDFPGDAGPQILPVGLDSKVVADETPIICPPAEDVVFIGMPEARDASDILGFGGRALLARAAPADYDWIA